MSEAFAPALPHDPLVQVFDDVWFLRGVVPVALGTMTRTMTVIAQDGALTVVNAVRPTAAGQAALEALGTVRHVVKLGHHHDRDDGWYQAHYGATLWALPEHGHRGEVTTDRVLAPGRAPLPDAEVFVFDQAVRAGSPEAALVLRRHGGILVACDAVQNLDRLTHCSWGVALYLRATGAVGPGEVGPRFRKAVDTESGALQADLRRLLEQRFRHLFAGHGLPLLDTAHEDVAAAIDRLYP